MRRKVSILVLIVVLVFLTAQITSMRVEASHYVFPDGLLQTSPGAYQSAVTSFSKWDITKGDVTIEGTIDLGGIQARKNTWDPNTADSDHYFGLWTQIGLSKDPTFNSPDGVWFVTVEWLGGGDDPNTQIREIFHMQEEPGTQPMPKLYTGPRTIVGGDGDDTYTFKMQIHSTGATTGWAKLWIDGVQVNPCPPPVGGVWVPINKFELLGPWIGLASLIAAATVSIVYTRYKKKQQN